MGKSSAADPTGRRYTKRAVYAVNAEPARNLPECNGIVMAAGCCTGESWVQSFSPLGLGAKPEPLFFWQQIPRRSISYSNSSALALR
ncbi:MAG: hypothetical protein HY717_24200 [Planctomycetes bacterium]|nr:hypothetical protein [Planctomycetota bacterium]